VIIGVNGQPTLVMLTVDEAWEKIRRSAPRLFRDRADVQDFYDRGDAPFAEWVWREATEEDVKEASRPVLNPPAGWKAKEER